MSTIVTRVGKGSPLTWTEVDSNFTNLNTDKLQSGNTASSLTITSATINGGSINGTTVGASTASTGAFTTLLSNGATTFTAGTASTSTTTGTAVITGGLGVSGRINAANFDGIVGANTAAAGSFTTLSATGVTTVQAGTVSLPAITTSGDTNTGIYFPAADTIAFTEGGTESMRIDSAGNVGIGITPSPADLPTVENAYGLFSGQQQMNLATNAYYNSGWKYQGTGLAARYFVDRAGGQHIWYTAPSGTAGNAITFTERMRIDSSGNVGIGTASPSYKVDINNAVSRIGDSTGLGFLQLGSSSTASNNFHIGDNAGAFIFYQGNYGSGTERMRIDSSGNVGIGTTSPACTLALNGTGATGGQIQFQRNGTLQGNIYGTSSAFRIENTSSTPIVFLQNTGTEYMRITSAGDVGIGTTSPAARLETNVASGNNEFRMTIAGTASAQFISTTTDFTFVNLKTGAQVFFNNGAERMRIDSSGNVGIGTSSPGVKLDVNGQRIKIQNASDPGIEFHNASTIKGYVFYDTTNDLMTMRHNSTSTGVSVNSSGNVLVGTTASNGKLSTETASATQRTIHAASNGGSATTDGVYYGYVNQARGTGFNFMAFQNTSAVDFKVLGNGNVQNTNNSYGAISDVKLKENIVDATPKLDDLMKVKVRHYNFIDDESKTKQIGVVAQEIEQVFSGIVENIPDRDEEGNTLNSVTKSVKYSVFVPMLIKAIQEQTQIINDLKARIETLEGK
jgi:hypothetical protein